jgi:hypothetical protein
MPFYPYNVHSKYQRKNTESRSPDIHKTIATKTNLSRQYVSFYSCILLISDVLHVEHIIKEVPGENNGIKFANLVYKERAS